MHGSMVTPPQPGWRQLWARSKKIAAGSSALSRTGSGFGLGQEGKGNRERAKQQPHENPKPHISLA